MQSHRFSTFPDQDYNEVWLWTFYSCVWRQGVFYPVFSVRLHWCEKVLGEVGAGQAKNSSSKSKDGGKEAAGFNFGGSTGSKFGTAFSTQPIQVQLQ